MRRRTAVPAAALLTVLLTACMPLEDGATPATDQGGYAASRPVVGPAPVPEVNVSSPVESAETPEPVQDPAVPSDVTDVEEQADASVAAAGTPEPLPVRDAQDRADRAERSPEPTSVAVSSAGSTRGNGRAKQPAPAVTDPSPSPVAPSPVPATTRGERIGVSIPASQLHHADGDAMERRLDEVAALGAHWVRTDANWAWVEPKKGSPDWSELDALVSAASARGLELSLIVGTMPAWLRPAGATAVHGPSTAAERLAFTDFASRLADRYAGQVGAWEVWNEPNLDQFWAPKPDAADYTALLRAVYPALKSADPATPVLIGGTGGAGSGDVDSVTWYRDVYAHGGGSSFDIANMHPYQDWRAAALGHQDTGEMQRVPQVRQIMVANGDADKVMWGTEFGAPTAGGLGISEDGQRTVYTDGRDRWLAIEDGPLFVYYLRDRADYGASSSHSSYWGLKRFDGSSKPAYDALAEWIAAG